MPYSIPSSEAVSAGGVILRKITNGTPNTGRLRNKILESHHEPIANRILLKISSG